MAITIEEGQSGESRQTVSEIFRPKLLKVLDVKPEIPLVNTFTLDRNGFAFQPGQFVEVSVFGVGEVPISISSPPSVKEKMVLTIRNSGTVTSAIHQVQPGEFLGVRGPFGRPFPMKEFEGFDILFVAGGIGLAPLRSLLEEMLAHRGKFNRIILLYGARTPRDLMYTETFDSWEHKGVELRLSVDVGDGVWEKETHPPRRVGVVTTLLDDISINTDRTVSFVCGPPIMIKFCLLDLERKMNLPPERCIVTLERHMKCGVGKCGHCVVGDKYVCVDGPVFTHAELKRLATMEEPW